jgi:hypothetical protein
VTSFFVVDPRIRSLWIDASGLDLGSASDMRARVIDLGPGARVSMQRP